jgi:hypothetical protein
VNEGSLNVRGKTHTKLQFVDVLISAFNFKRGQHVALLRPYDQKSLELVRDPQTSRNDHSGNHGIVLTAEAISMKQRRKTYGYA